jgi:cytochrome c-type biogenesis protein CcmH
MTAFILAALTFLAVTAFFLLRPLLRAHANDADETQLEITRAILQGQLAELEKAQQEGQLSAADFAEARDDLKRRILEEAARAETKINALPPGANRGLAIVVFLLLALSSGVGYALLGAPAALDPLERQAQAPASMSQEQIEAKVAQLAAFMEANPEDEQGWVKLGNAYKTLQRPAEAAKSYARAENLIAADPTLLGYYAETLAASGEGFKGKPTQLIHEALKLDPDHAHALFLAGAAAYEANDKASAADYWEKLLPKVEPGSEVHTLLQEKITAFRAESSAQGRNDKNK